VDSVSITAKQEVVDKLAKYLDLNPLTVHFFHLLIDARRVDIFGTIHEEYETRRADLHSIVYADVTVADEMDMAASERLKNVLSTKTGKVVVLRIKRTKVLLVGWSSR
jgi:F0F1-type ATP synthase delta subunit